MKQELVKCRMCGEDRETIKHMKSECHEKKEIETDRKEFPHVDIT